MMVTEMTHTLPTMVVGVNNEQELLEVIRRYRGLRTYPQAHEASQRHLHEVCVALARRGLVVGREAGSVWLWSVA